MQCTESNRPERILLVDDELQIRDMLRNLIIRNGYEVITAANGQEALEKFKEHPEVIDLLVTDIIMPGMDGVTSFKEMQKISPTLKVIFMTGFVDNLPPYAHIILKPFSPLQLLQMIRLILDNKPSYQD
jgi:DNA-binding NtrC family response regulator